MFDYEKKEEVKFHYPVTRDEGGREVRSREKESIPVLSYNVSTPIESRDIMMSLVEEIYPDIVGCYDRSANVGILLDINNGMVLKSVIASGRELEDVKGEFLGRYISAYELHL